MTSCTSPTQSQFEAGNQCFELGKSVESAVKTSTLECRYQRSGDMSFVELTGNNDAPLSKVGLTDINTCKLIDQRPLDGFGGKMGGQNTAFPLTNTYIPPTGDIQVGIIPIDFSDSEAESSVSDVMDKQLEDIENWLEFTTHGVTKYHWHIPDKWLRMPLESEFYKYAKQNIGPDGNYITVSDQLQSTEEMTTQIFSAAEEYMNLDEIDYFWVVLPPTTFDVDWTANGNHRQITTNSGVHDITFYSLANVLWNQQSLQAPMYSIMLHEMIHAHGATQHAPGNEFPLNIGNSLGTIMGAWDSFILGWRPDSSFACIDGTVPTDTEVTLTPLDLDNKGYKAAFIKVSDTQIVVLESRRKGRFSYKWVDGSAFSTAYLVDVSKPSLRFDGDNTRVKDYFAYYLDIVEPHESEIDLGHPLANMNGPSEESFSVKNIALLGDVFEYGDLKIEVIKQADTDTFHISKING